MTKVAVLGGGQLGRMLGLAALPLGVTVSFLDPNPDAPAGSVGSLVVGTLDDAASLQQVTQGATVTTYEWEGVPATSAELVTSFTPVYPPVGALAVSQDRLAEKTMFTSLGVAVAPFRQVDSLDELRRAVEELGLPAILKTRRGGYDGKGQVVLSAPGEIPAAWDELGGAALILEALVPFTRELSILCARGVDGSTVVWPLTENTHGNGILRVSRAPAPFLTPELVDAAQSIATRTMEHLDYRGVLAIELFQHGNSLLVNEMAPRVHNSGHWTIEGSVTSQFENHLRAILGLPLGVTDARGASVMVNCIGGMPDRHAVLAIPGAHFHDYGKAARPGRKVGHITLTASDADAEVLPQRLATLQSLISDASR